MLVVYFEVSLIDEDWEDLLEGKMFSEVFRERVVIFRVLELVVFFEGYYFIWGRERLRKFENYWLICIFDLIYFESFMLDYCGVFGILGILEEDDGEWLC